MKTVTIEDLIDRLPEYCNDCNKAITDKDRKIYFITGVCKDCFNKKEVEHEVH